MYVTIFLTLALVYDSTCIMDGVEANKTYVVYIVWDENSEMKFKDKYTICGGVLLNESLVLTSATCLKWHEEQYVIAGYNRYVPFGVGRNEEEKECMEIAKRKIIGRGYSGGEPPVQRLWFKYDVGIATLEKSYNFDDDSFVNKCSYKPTKAELNYEEVEKDDNVILLGWGSVEYQRPDGYQADMNQKFLRAASTKVLDEHYCKDIYRQYMERYNAIYKFCVDGKAYIDSKGYYLGLNRRHMLNNNTGDNSLFALDAENVLYNNKTVGWPNKFRRSLGRIGACQNDHGGPVVTYKEGKEVVVGLITAYIINSKYQCVGPTLCTKFTDRADNEKFIHKFINLPRVN